MKVWLAIVYNNTGSAIEAIEVFSSKKAAKEFRDRVRRMYHEALFEGNETGLPPCVMIFEKKVETGR